MANLIPSQFSTVVLADDGGLSLKGLNNSIPNNFNNTGNVNYGNNNRNYNSRKPFEKNTELYLLDDSGIVSPADTLKAYIEYMEKTKKELEEKLSILRSSYSKAAIPPLNGKYKPLASFANMDGSLKSPYDLKGVSSDQFFVEQFLVMNIDRYLENGKGRLTPELYDKVQSDFNEWIDGEYTTLYNEFYYDYFQEVVGMTREEYDKEIASLEADLLQINSLSYALKQQQKVLPYTELSDSQSYADYQKNNKEQSIKVTYTTRAGGREVIPIVYVNGQKVDNYSSVDPIALSLAVGSSAKHYFGNYFIDDIEYINEDERQMYSYLFNTQGKAEADKYLEAIKDVINQRKGQKEAEDFLKSIR